MTGFSRVGPHVVVIAAIVGFLAVAVAWASIAEVEMAAAAPGRIVPEGQVKTVKPFEPGKIERIAVEEGSAVSAGDVLVALDTTLVDAELAKFVSELGVKLVEAARLEALVGWRDGVPFRPPADAPPTIVAINRRLLADQIAVHRSRIAELDGQIAERRAQIRTLEAGAARIDRLLPIVRERATMRKSLYEGRDGSRLDFLDERVKVVELEGDLRVKKAESAEARAARDALVAQRANTLAAFLRQGRSDLAAVETQTLLLRQDIRRARERLARHVLVSPVDGVVQDLAVHTEDGAIEAGRQLMVIVPRDAGLQVEAFVSNSDVGFVRPGQRATLKVATFDFRRYGAVEGTVISVSRDATSLPAPRGAAASANPGGVGEAVFRTLIELDRSHLDIDGRSVSLSSGMAVEAAILLGRQKIIEYVLKPLEGYRQDAFREK